MEYIKQNHLALIAIALVFVLAALALGGKSSFRKASGTQANSESNLIGSFGGNASANNDALPGVPGDINSVSGDLDSATGQVSINQTPEADADAISTTGLTFDSGEGQSASSSQSTSTTSNNEVDEPGPVVFEDNVDDSADQAVATPVTSTAPGGVDNTLNDTLVGTPASPDDGSLPPDNAGDFENPNPGTAPN